MINLYQNSKPSYAPMSTISVNAHSGKTRTVVPVMGNLKKKNHFFFVQKKPASFTLHQFLTNTGTQA